MADISILTTSGMTSYINTWKSSQTTSRVTPLTTKKNTYSAAVSLWGSVSSKLSTLKTSLSTLKQTGTDSVFQTKSVTSTNEDAITASANSSATPTVYNIKVNQLAKNDILLSSQVSSSKLSSLGDTAQKQTITLNDGTYYSNVSLDLAAATSRTDSNVMSALSTAINGDYYAKVTDGNSSGFSPLTVDSSNNSFKINLNGTTKTISISEGTYNSYDNLVDEIVNKVNNSGSGVNAEKVDGKLKIASNSQNTYVAVDTSTVLAKAMNFTDDKKYKAASNIASVSVFTPANNESRLSITAKQSGTGKLNISDGSSSSLLNSLGMDSSTLSDRTAKLSSGSSSAGWVYIGTGSNQELDAKLDFNGTTVVKNSNTVTDLVSGVTFNLKKTTSEATTVTIKNDTSTITGNINSFITAFNDVYTTVKNNMKSGSTSTRGKLAGDATATSLVDQLRTRAMQSISANGDIKSLSDLGISFDVSTGLSITDSTKFNNALQTNISSVESFFNTTTNDEVTSSNVSGLGFSERFLWDAVTPFIEGRKDSNGNQHSGLITNITSSYNKNITTLTTNITSMNERITKEADALKKKLQSAQTQLASLLNSQSTFNSIYGSSSSTSSSSLYT